MHHQSSNDAAEQALAAQEKVEQTREQSLRQRLSQQTQRYFRGSSGGSGFFDQPNTPGSTLGG